MSQSAAAHNISMTAQRKEMEDILAQLQVLPTLPTIVYELNRIINDPNSSASDISKVMSQDQSLTAKVLQLVNSAYYGIPGGIANLQRAISYLGYDTVNQLVMAATVFKTLNKATSTQFKLEDFWKHAIGVAMASEVLAKRINFPSPPDCFTCGLLHDVGKVARCLVSGPYMDEVSEMAKARHMTFLAVEMQLQRVPHNIVGAMLARTWKLPSIIENAMIHHHEPQINSRGFLKPDVNQIIDIVYTANNLVHELKFGDSGHDQVFTMNETVLKRLNIPAVQIPLIVKDIGATLGSADAFLKIISG